MELGMGTFGNIKRSELNHEPGEKRKQKAGSGKGASTEQNALLEH